jgi:hypothetical protein
MLGKIKNLFSTPKDDETMASLTATSSPKTQSQASIELPLETDQLSATSECCSGKKLCQNAVRERAYLLWEKAGYPSGDGTDFWVAAEQELLAE